MPSASTAPYSRASTSRTDSANGRADVTAPASSSCCPTRTCCWCWRKKAIWRWSGRPPTSSGNSRGSRRSRARPGTTRCWSVTAYWYATARRWPRSGCPSRSAEGSPPSHSKKRALRAGTVGARIEGWRSSPAKMQRRKIYEKQTRRTTGPGIRARAHHAAQLPARQRLAPDRLQHFRLVALRQPYDLPCGSGRQQAHAQFVFRLRSQPLDQRQPPAHPTLVASQQLCHLHLAQAVFPHQRLDDPGFFAFPRAAPGTIQPVDGGFRLTHIGLHEQGRQVRDLRKTAYGA